MKSRGSSVISVVLVCVLLLFLLSSAAWANIPGASTTTRATTSSAKLSQDIYTACTSDGVGLKMWRFRPTTQSPLRTGAQPVILTPGMACNFDFFDVHTPDGVTYDEKLPADLADWAVGDTYLRDTDPMRYYSLAYYLWKTGYDVWMANYRGQGRDEVRSDGATGYAIDELGIYDMPALISRVRELTGRKPVWAGHSMGGVMANMYLEGCRFEDMADANSRVISDPALAAERNDGDGPQALKGFISLDGPSYPAGDMDWIVASVLYAALYVPFNLDVRPITANLGGLVASPVLALEELFRQIWADFGSPDLPLPLSLLPCFYPENLDANITSFFITYAADGFSSRAVAQFLDACDNHKMREDYRNGTFNYWRLYPPTPAADDGYYYYSDNLDVISLPSLVLVDATRDITNPEDVKAVYYKKTWDPKDQCFVIPNTAHADIVLGLNAPTELYPKIGRWLKSLDAPSFSPTYGKPGDSVTIDGVGFGTSGTVKFGGMSAATSSWTDSRITAIVPAGVTYNKVSVTSAGGTAVSTGYFLPVASESYFAEGYTGHGSFQEYLCLGNLEAQTTHARAVYMFPNGTTQEQDVTVPASGRTTVDVNEAVGPDESVSALVVADRAIVAERPMYFNYNGLTGGHDVIGAPSSANTWYFAEGYTGAGFDEYVCVLNPGDTAADLTFRFQTQEAGELVKTGYAVGAHTRGTFKINDVLGPDYQASLKLESTQPVVAERPVYFNYHDAWSGGDCVMGAPVLSKEYYFAEGNTRAGFDEWLTLQNPGAADISVHAVYQLGEGAPIPKDYAVPAGSRKTLYVPSEVGPDKDVSVKLTSTSDFLAERPMYFDYQGAWTGGHCVIGATSPGSDWFFAEGYTGANFNEWLCLQNPGTTEATVEISYFTQEAGALPVRVIKVPAGSRRTIFVNSDAGENYQLSTRLEVTAGPGIVVERPMYFNYNGWDGGHDVVGYQP